jgi:hypothetical protein
LAFSPASKCRSAGPERTRGAKFLSRGCAAFNNFAPVDVLAEKAKADLKQMSGGDEAMENKQYIRIDSQDYEENARGVYYINGVATFAKKGKPAEPPKSKNPNGKDTD